VSGQRLRPCRCRVSRDLVRHARPPCACSFIRVPASLARARRAAHAPGAFDISIGHATLTRRACRASYWHADRSPPRESGGGTVTVSLRRDPIELLDSLERRFLTRAITYAATMREIRRLAGRQGLTCAISFFLLFAARWRMLN